MGGMPSAIRQIVAESGWGKLYEGLPSILFRQISFGMMKFLVFDFFTGKHALSLQQSISPPSREHHRHRVKINVTRI